MSGIRNPFACGAAEGAQGAASTKEEAVVFNAPPDDETVLTVYILIKRRPRRVFIGSALFIGTDLADAKKNVVDKVFGSGLPNTDDELLERYNVDVVEYDEEWEQKLDEFACESLA